VLAPLAKGKVLPVAFPNAWTRDLNQGAGGEVSEKRQKYQFFFQDLQDALRERKWSNAKKAHPQNWYAISSGHKGLVYGASFAAGGRLRVDLRIDPPGRQRVLGGVPQGLRPEAGHRSRVRGTSHLGEAGSSAGMSHRGVPAAVYRQCA